MDSRAFLLCGGLLLLAGAVEAAEVNGTIRLKGPVPAQEQVKIEPKTGVHSTEGCGSLEKASQRLVVDPGGGIQNAVVWLDLPAAGRRPAAADLAAGPDSILLDQRECLFSPHVVSLEPGGEVVIRNSDTVLHNIGIFREGNPDMLMHRWQKADAADVRWPFSEPGRYVVRCGVHPWMYAWVVVLPPGRSAVTGPDGRFSLAQVPPGRHELRVWHETLGERRVTVEVRDGMQPLDEILLGGE